MHTHHRILFIIAAACFAAGLWSGCTVGFDPGADDMSEVFPCESDDDCLQGFSCEDEWCEEITTGTPDAPPCVQDANPPGDIDLDNDGYGTGDIRTECPQPERDCNDDDPTVYPGAAELCDGQDNNCDGEGADGGHRIDEFDCESSLDCGSVPSHLNNHLTYTCEENTCVMRPPNRPPESTCAEIFVRCNATAEAFIYQVDDETYEADEGPVLECD